MENNLIDPRDRALIRNETRIRKLVSRESKRSEERKGLWNLETFFPFSIPRRKEKGETRSRNDVVGGLFNFASRQVARSR